LTTRYRAKWEVGFGTLVANPLTAVPSPSFIQCKVHPVLKSNIVTKFFDESIRLEQFLQELKIIIAVLRA